MNKDITKKWCLLLMRKYKKVRTETIKISWLQKTKNCIYGGNNNI